MDRSVAIVVALGSLIVFLKALGDPLGARKPVAKRFLTPRETAMLVALERALPHCRIHAQVAMGALLAAPRPLFRKSRYSDRNSFSQKIVDFVAQDRNTGVIVALIECDDWSHNPVRDSARDAMTSNAGYRTIRIPGRVQPRFHDIIEYVGGLRRDTATSGTATSVQF